MGRLTYVCATCSEHFTRKYSATRHNFTIHGNRGEIVTLLEYLVGRSSGRYRQSHPSLYRRGHGEKSIHNFGRTTTVAPDSMGDTFPPGCLQGQYYHHYHQQPPPVSISPASIVAADQTISQSQRIETTTTNANGTLSLSLSEQTALKIRELKKLMLRYPIFPNPDMVIQCVTHFSMNGDNSLLDEKLEQLRMLDNAMGYASTVCDA